MRLQTLVAVLLATAAMAGCTQPDGDSPGNPEGPGDDASAGTYAPGWPEPEDAAIRPGVQVGEIPGLDAGSCTTNFVFASPDNRTLYIGTAAHCLLDTPIGEPVPIAGGVATGTHYYNSWQQMNENGTFGAACQIQAGNPEHCMNDLALIEIDDADRGLVHPAVRHFGGPVGLANSSALNVGDKVISYGNSAFRFQTEPSNWKEGYVIHSNPPWRTNAYFVTPNVQGDSGSAVLTGDGRALGVFSTVNLTAWNGVSNLDAVLEFAREDAGVTVRLATWERMEDDVLPE